MLSEINRPDGAHSGQSSMTNSATVNRQQQQRLNEQQQPPQQRHHLENMTNILNHAAAAAAGQARANSNEMQEINVERLVAASGFGQIHEMNVTTKPHHMLGRNVTVTQQANQGGDHQREGEQGSQSSSIPSNDGPFPFMVCRMGVSPVVSASNAMDLSPPQVVTDHENSSKRRKHHNNHSYRRHTRTTIVTHYVIQLERVVATAYDNKQQPNGSQSSQSNSNRKPPAGDDSDLPQAAAAGDEDYADNGTEATDPREPVSAIG